MHQIINCFINSTGIRVVLLLLFPAFLYAQHTPSVPATKSAFTENKGQLRNQTNVLFYYDAPGMRICIRKDGLSYSFIKRLNSREYSKGHPDSILISQVSMQLMNVNINTALVKKIHQRKATSNYFLEHCPKGILNVGAYDTVLVPNIYHGIDWQIYTSAKGIKYDFILHPGADPRLIQMQFFGIDSLSTSNYGQELHLHSPMGKIIEGHLKSFNTLTKEIIPSSYQLNGKTVSYTITVPQGATVTIDPPLLWSTYFGGIGLDEACNMALGPENSFMIDGTTLSLNLPTVNPGSGAFFAPTLVGPNTDVYLCKFDSARQLVWSTYFGSSGNENPWGGLCIDSAGHIYVVGNASTTDLPRINTGGGMYFQNVQNGFWDLFIATFTENGVLFRNTFYGGNFVDTPIETVLDGQGHLYITGTTQSTDFPPFNPGGGAYYQSLIGGNEDLFLLKLDTSGVRLWSTFIGGPNNDGLMDMCTDKHGNIFLSATTSSPALQFPLFDPGGFSYFYTGPNASNLILMKFGPQSNLMWSTGLGPASALFGLSMETGPQGQLYVAGTCWADDLVAVDPGNGAWVQSPPANLTGSTPMIMMFDTSLALKWLTVIHASNALGGFNSVQVDTSGNVYAVGSTSALSEQILNPGNNSFFQSTNAGGIDMFVMRFSPTHVRQWSTFIGGDLDEGYGVGYNHMLNSSLIDQNQHLLLFNMTKSTNMPLKNRGNGAYIDSTSNGDFDAMLMEFGTACETPNAPTSIPFNGSQSLCMGDTLILSCSLVSGTTQYTWTATQGVSIFNPSTTHTQFVIVDSAGTVCVSTANGCGLGGMTCITLTPYSPSGIIPFVDTTVCPGDSLMINLLSTASAHWTPSIFLNDSTTASPVAVPYNNVSYNIEMSDVHGCISNDSIQIYVNDTCNIQVGDCSFIFGPNPAAGFISLSAMCNSDSLSHIRLRLFNVLGQIVYENIDLINGTNTLDHFELADAMYLYVISDEKKIIKSGKILNVKVN